MAKCTSTPASASFADVRPVLHVARAAVNLVDDYTLYFFPNAQEAEHVAEFRPARVRGAFPLLEPARDLQLVDRRGIALDGSFSVLAERLLFLPVGVSTPGRTRNTCPWCD